MRLPFLRRSITFLSALMTKRARAFCEPLMIYIGFRLLKASDKAVPFGSSDIMFSLETPINGLPATPGNGVHIAFQAPTGRQ